MSSTTDTKPCGCTCPCNCTEPKPNPTPEPEDKGRTKDWGSVDDNPHNWKVVKMSDDSTKFKVVDKNKVNVADLFRTEKGAQKFIDDAIKIFDSKPQPKPEPIPTPTPTPTPQPTGNVDSFGVLKIYPDADSHRFLTNSEVEAKTRHYASGKPDDNSIECNIDTKDKKFRDMEATIVIVNKGMEHHDRFSYKLRGGAHKDGQGWWYIFEVSTDGKWTNESFQIEKPHPKYYEYGDKIKPLVNNLGDLRNATIGIKAITINRVINGKEAVHLEQWINLDPITADGKPKNEGWQKYMEVDDVGQFKNGLMLECQGTNVTMRIDGILSIKDKAKMPDFHFCSVREIKNN